MKFDILYDRIILSLTLNFGGMVEQLHEILSILELAYSSLISCRNSLWIFLTKFTTIIKTFSFIVIFIFLFNYFFGFTKKINIKSTKQLGKFKDNGKYIEGLFVELNNTKELLRYFIYGKKWKKRIIKKFNDLYDNYCGEVIRIATKKDNLKYKFNKFSSLQEIFKEIEKHKGIFDKYVDKKHSREIPDELEENPLIATHTYQEAFAELLLYIQVINSNFIILTGSAGNGKTNLLCNIFELIKNLKLPCVFLNSRDIPSKVSDTFYKSLNIPIFLSGKEKIIFFFINKIFKIFRKNFFIIIDAINENDTPIFKSSIAEFINEILEYSNVKIILSCRKEYFESRYKELFEDKIQIKPLIYDIKDSYYNKRAVNKIFLNYRKHFNFTGNITKPIYNSLANHLLLMRMFFEVNRDSNNDVRTLNKFEIYHQYVDLIKKQAPDVEELLNIIIEKMVDNLNFSQILTEELNLGEKIENFKKIADDNILISRVIVENENTIAETEKEAFNFVFDEFRDYCIARYFIIKCQKTGDENYKSLFEFISNLTEKRLSPLEGILRYIYFFFKTQNDTERCKLILGQCEQLYFQHSRGLYAENNGIVEFDNFGISLIFDCEMALWAFEKEYIFNILSNNVHDAFNLFKFLRNCEYTISKNYSFELFFDFLMQIEEYNALKNILKPFDNIDEEDDVQSQLLRILKRINERGNGHSYYKFLIVLSLIFPYLDEISDTVEKYDKCIDIVKEIETKSRCSELKNKVKIEE